MPTAPRPLLAALLVAAACLGTAWAQSPPPAPARYFNDYAGVVPAAAADGMDRTLRAFDEETTSQVLVAVFPELPSPSLEDFTVRTAEAWKVGRKELDNGVVLFVFVKDRRVRMEVGYGLEGALPDALAKRIIEERITPAFREGDYAKGLDAGIDAIIAATRGEYTAPPRRGGRPPEGLLLLIPVAFLLLNLWLFSRVQRGRYVTYSPRGRRSGRTIWYGSRRDSSWGGGGGGGGWSGGGGGGGFSGGGGSFGGGGASGSW